MKCKNKILIIFLFSMIYCFGQIEKIEKEEIKNIQTGRVEVYVVPTSYANFLAPRFRIGAQHYFHDKFSYSLDLAYGDTDLLLYSYDLKYNAFEIRPSFKFTPVRTKKFVYFVGLEMLYLERNVKIYNDNYSQENGVDVSFDEADSRTRKSSLYLINGIKLIASNRITFESFFGFGGSMITVDYFNVKNPDTTYDIELASMLFFPYFLIYDNDSTIEGLNYHLSMTLGFKVGVFLN